MEGWERLDKTHKSSGYRKNTERQREPGTLREKEDNRATQVFQDWFTSTLGLSPTSPTGGWNRWTRSMELGRVPKSSSVDSPHTNKVPRDRIQRSTVAIAKSRVYRPEQTLPPRVA